MRYVCYLPRCCRVTRYVQEDAFGPGYYACEADVCSRRFARDLSMVYSEFDRESNVANATLSVACGLIDSTSHLHVSCITYFNLAKAHLKAAR